MYSFSDFDIGVCLKIGCPEIWWQNIFFPIRMASLRRSLPVADPYQTNVKKHMAMLRFSTSAWLADRACLWPSYLCEGNLCFSFFFKWTSRVCREERFSPCPNKFQTWSWANCFAFHEFLILSCTTLPVAPGFLLLALHVFRPTSRVFACWLACGESLPAHQAYVIPTERRTSQQEDKGHTSV